MSHFYIELQKLKEDFEQVSYHFLTDEGSTGIVKLNKKTRSFEFDLCDPSENQKKLLNRICMKLNRHCREGSFPDKSVWCG